MMTTEFLQNISISKNLLHHILRESLKGKSLSRILLNYALSEIELTGDIIDLGAGSNSASYNRFLRYQTPYTVTYTDFYKSNSNLIQLNLEEPFAIESESFDTVLCFNTLEHIYNYQNVLNESHRILKKGGIFIGSTPFSTSFHPDPHDYFRYTHEAILKMFSKEKWICQRIVYLGFGPLSESVSILLPFLSRIIRPLMICPAIAFDMILVKKFTHLKNRYPLAYFFIFNKES